MGKWRHYKESVEYRIKEKKECHFCHNKGRDVKFRPGFKRIDKPICNNCYGDLMSRGEIF